MKLTQPAWSCYPMGTGPSRRAFLQALTAVGAATIATAGQEPVESTIGTDDEPIPGFPPGGFPKGSARLNFNENPLGPSPLFLRAIRENGLADGNRYNYIDPVIDAIARHHEVPSGNVLIGCGSTEFLQFVPWALLRDGGNIVLPTPTYGWSGGVAESMGREAIRVPLGPMGVVDVPRLSAATNGSTRIVYVANPNNPTGASIDPGDVRSLASTLPDGCVLVVDEAYNDFLPDGKSALDLVREGAPVLVTRTYSKAFGLAGLRLGYAIGPDDVIEQVKSVWWGDFGINAAAHVAGPVALADREHVRRYVSTIDEGLDQLRAGMKKLGHQPWPHRAPFFMVDIGRPARPVVRSLMAQNIFVQDGSAWDLPSFLRVSVSTAAENDTFLRAMTAIG